MTLAKIFSLLRIGDKSGVEFLYTHHYNKLYGIAFSIVRDDDSSKDIVHNVISKFLSLDVDKFPVAYEATWLYKVVKNEALTFLQKKKPTISIDVIAELSIKDNNIENFIDMENYNSIVANLNDEQRSIVTLKIMGGYTHKEISKMLGRPIGTIQWIYNTSIKQLKVILSSLFVSIIAVGIGVITNTFLFIEKTISQPEMSGEPIPVKVDFVLIAMFILLVALITSFIVVYKKSDKIPTKLKK